MTEWRYTGYGQPRAYQDYVDVATGRMLVAQAGGVYDMRATWDRLPVPPADGWWKPEPPSGGAEAASAVPVAGEPAPAVTGVPPAT